MGQFLIIGLKLKACVYKDSINNYINEERTEADILTELEEALRLGKEYDRQEKEDYYTYSLKQEICEKELLPFPPFLCQLSVMLSSPPDPVSHLTYSLSISLRPSDTVLPMSLPSPRSQL